MRALVYDGGACLAKRQIGDLVAHSSVSLQSSNKPAMDKPEVILSKPNRVIVLTSWVKTTPPCCADHARMSGSSLRRVDFLRPNDVERGPSTQYAPHEVVVQILVDE